MVLNRWVGPIYLDVLFVSQNVAQGLTANDDDDDDDDEPAVDMDDFEESGMMEAEDPVQWLYS